MKFENFVLLSHLFFIRIYLRLYVFVFDQILTKFGNILRIALRRNNVGFLFFSKLETRTLHLFYSRFSYIFDFKFQKEKKNIVKRSIKADFVGLLRVWTDQTLNNLYCPKKYLSVLKICLAQLAGSI